MSNPWTRNAATAWPQGPNQSPDNFSGLASGAAKALGVINPSPTTAPWGDLIIPPWKFTLASAPTTGGLIQVYLLFSEDNTTWPGGISPTSTSSQISTLQAWQSYDSTGAAAALLFELTASNSVTVYQTREFTIRGMSGQVPSYATALVYNNTSVAFAAFSAGNQVATYATETYV